MSVDPAIRLPWRHGPAQAGDMVAVTATRFTFITYPGLARAAPHALRFWLNWRRIPGAVGISIELHPLTREAWTLTAWREPADLSAFLRSPAHRTVVTGFDTQLAGSSRSWQAPEFDLAGGWREAKRLLGSQEQAASRPTSPRPRR